MSARARAVCVRYARLGLRVYLRVEEVRVVSEWRRQRDAEGGAGPDGTAGKQLS